MNLKTNTRRMKALTSLILLTLSVLLLFTSCAAGQANNTINYADKGAAIANFEKTTITLNKDAFEIGKKVASGSVEKESKGALVDNASYYVTPVINVPHASTVVVLTIQNYTSVTSNGGEYLILSSWTPKSNGKGFDYSNSAANYTVTDTTSASIAKKGEGDSDTFTLTYVTGKANECLRFCFPAEFDEEGNLINATLTVKYDPTQKATYAGQASPWWTILIQVGIIAVIIFLFYFFLLRPQKKQEKNNAEMRNQLAVGDEITTISGIIGEVVSIKEETVTIETGRDKVQIRILRDAIRSVDLRAADKANAASGDSKSE